MTLRQLRYFVEIAQLRSFTRASEVLHIAQSALSRQVRSLEDEFGVRLLNRLDRGVTLTEAGERLLARAELMLSNFDQLRDEVTNAAGEPRGPLNLGLPPSLREMINTPLIHQYAQRHSLVKLHVHEGISLDLEQFLIEGRIDCALMIDLETSGAVRSRPVLREQLFLVGPTNADLDRKTPMDIDAVTRHELILTTRPNSLRLIVENALATTGRPYRIVADFNATGFMVELVKGGLAFSVLPYSAVWRALENREVSIAPIKELAVDWIFAHRRDHPPSLAGLAVEQLVREIAEQRIASGEWRGTSVIEAG